MKKRCAVMMIILSLVVSVGCSFTQKQKKQEPVLDNAPNTIKNPPAKETTPDRIQ
jgi:hypothetical protein